MLSKSKIKSEISKKNPDWVLISNMALQMHNDTLESNFFKFKKGKLNVIKASEYNCDVIKDALEECMNGEEYKYILVGSYRGMTVTKFNRLIDGLVKEVNDKYVVVVTNKDQAVTNSLRKGLLVNPYNATVRDKWTKNKTTTLFIKGEGFEMKCPLKEIKSHIRDLKIGELID
jgi:hypothetical protein